MVREIKYNTIMNELDFIKELQQNHTRSINRIVELIDVDSERVKSYPEYQDAAMLCKFVYDRDNKYELLAHPQEHGRFYESASDFETLCDAIHHALVDDGDICFVKVFDHACPRIVFKDRWTLTVDDLVTKDQKEHIKRFNEFKRSKGLPVEEPKITFYQDVHEYIEAVRQYDVDAEATHQRAKEVVARAQGNSLQ
jgi:hypothetical protein